MYYYVAIWVALNLKLFLLVSIEVPMHIYFSGPKTTTQIYYTAKLL